MLYEVMTGPLPAAVVGCRIAIDEMLHEKFGLDFDVLFGPAYKGIPLTVATTMAISDLYDKDIRYCSNRKEVNRITSYNVCYTKLLRHSFLSC